MNLQHRKKAQKQKVATVEEVEVAVREILLASNIDQRTKRTKIKTGTKLHFPLMDATGPKEEFESDNAECELVFAKVQKMLDRKFPGFQAEQEMGRAYPQSNAYLIITIKWPPVPPAAPASPSRRAKNIDRWWLSGADAIDHQPGQAETLPPTWYYITVGCQEKRWLNWIVIGPKSKITKEFLGREIENKTGKKVDVTGFHIYGSTCKPSSRWLLANGFFTDLIGKEETRQREQEEASKQPPNRKQVIPSPEAFKMWLQRDWRLKYRKGREPEILPACWKRLLIDIHFSAERKNRTVQWLVIEERPQNVKHYHDLILADLQELLATKEIVIKSMTVAGKEGIPLTRGLLKHGFCTDVPMAEIERNRALQILDEMQASRTK